MAHVYQLATSCHDGSGNFFQNVFHYELSEAGVATPFQYALELANAWQAGCLLDYLALLGTDVIVDFLSAKKVTGGGGPTATVADGSSGSGGNPSLSSGLAADLAWQSGAASHRAGHTYIPSVPEGAIQNGKWVVGYVNLLNTFIATMLGALTLAGGLGNADFATFTRKTATASPNTQGSAKPKPTMLNRRTLPVI